MHLGRQSSEKRPLLLGCPNDKVQQFVLAVHGGAGTILRERSTPERRAEYKRALCLALEAGYAVLQDGGEALDAAVAAVSVLEDYPLFNAGKGAVFNIEGKHELEASIMLSRPPATEGAPIASRRGLAAALLTRVRNPCRLVRALYLAPDLAPHVLLSGATAERLGEALGTELVDPTYFFTEARWREHRRGLGLPEEPLPYGHAPSPSHRDMGDRKGADLMPKGTVGAVALDKRGCIAVATSTGGKTNKLHGRIGDTPQAGTGFWAEEWTVRKGWFTKAWNHVRGKPRQMAVGVSGTGDGDYFIRQATACSLARRMQYLHERVNSAAQHVVGDLRRDGGQGGVIAIDRSGNVAMPLNCPGMYRGVIREDGVAKTAIFYDDVLE